MRRDEVVKKVNVKDGLVLKAYLDRDTVAWLNQVGSSDISDEQYAERLEQQGWKLVSVVSATSEFHDKEMWFRKD
ncbi:hypothetical protein C5B42_01795 [Candidatus Cerribacteria bacterium 'Amazon FNV 2010 28 9']|uniref:DUF4177 domain-containing protein n=1 Tax=Candidatus Cerribacteria bacterium 'Amazon FNV 2010 28 9' TaxID=2081795 RepID=A0A317JPR4_9BACT|nr:MAG: hypothetical protein C5B42_01795 [Candidatus Cerribacteria bacterium 'Amazon FNV 2010 28 9']